MRIFNMFVDIKWFILNLNSFYGVLLWIVSGRTANFNSPLRSTFASATKLTDEPQLP